ncbi:MAG: hypothetical protein N3A57_04295 [Negativicutes bacterium]|nr:hypothetical protein [Negativicutes bacterium]
MRRLFWQVMSLIVLVLTVTAVTAAADGGGGGADDSVPIDESVGVYYWDTGWIYAHGRSAYTVNQDPGTPASGMALSQKDALDKAGTALEVLVGMVQVSSDSSVRRLMLDDNGVLIRVRKIMNDYYQMMTSNKMDDGTWDIWVGLPLYGDKSVAKAVLPYVRMEQEDPLKAFPKPSKDYQAGSGDKAYTGVIINTKGLKNKPCLLPVIYDDSGRIVYSQEYLPLEKLIDTGMASFVAPIVLKNDVLLKNTRAGSNPLVIDAVSLKDGRYNLVIKKTDADRLLAINAANGILQNCQVAIVMSQQQQEKPSAEGSYSNYPL